MTMRDVLRPASRQAGLLVAVLAAMWMMAASPAHAADARAFFDVPAADLAGRDPDGVFPQGQRFPFMIYGQGAAGGKAFGSTVAGHMYRFSPEALAEVVKHDMHAVARVSGGWNKDQLATVSEQEIRQVIGDKVKEMLTWPGQERIAWWYLTPEELRYWRKHEIDYLRIATETIRQADPLRRPIWMYDPGHRNAPALAHTAAHLEIVGKGIYTNYSKQMNDRVWVRWSLQQQKLAMADSKHAVASIAVPEMFEHPGKYDPTLLEDERRAVDLIRAWVRHDVYASLIEGAQGVAVFAISRRPRNTPPFTGDIYKAYHDTYSQVARELTGELDLGRAFLFGQRRSDIRVEVVDGPATVSLTFMKNPEQTFPAVGHADLAWDGHRYLVLANSAPQPVRVKLSGFPAGQTDFHSLIDQAHLPTAKQKGGEIELTFQPWQVRVYRMDRAGASAGR